MTNEGKKKRSRGEKKKTKGRSRKSTIKQTRRNKVKLRESLVFTNSGEPKSKNFSLERKRKIFFFQFAKKK